MSKSSNFLLFLIPALIWGSTWFVITFQLGKVDPLISVSYRFFIGGAILLVYALVRKLPMAFTWKQHLRAAQQGVLLFGINYWLVYISEQTLTSGLVAVAFSSIVFFNIVFGALFFKASINRRVVLGAILGFLGTVLIYKAEFASFQSSTEYLIAVVFALSSVIIASLGNITSAINQKNGMPVIQTVAYGMIYGALVMALIAILLGKPFAIDTSFAYLASLGYLSIFGSVIAFTAYLTLIGRIGADKAAYAIVFVPIIAIIISAVFEDYRLDIYAIFGMGLIIVANVVALLKRESNSVKKKEA
ncbi:MAG: EamA family transporter [Cyclobacteriaceae bacterium]|nr:EamA family transporter [Cyclobacteriaceae bacterium]